MIDKLYDYLQRDYDEATPNAQAAVVTLWLVFVSACVLLAATIVVTAIK